MPTPSEAPKPGSRPSSSDILRGERRILPDPGTRLGELTPTPVAAPTSAEKSAATPPTAISVEGTGWDPQVKPSHASLDSTTKS